jgi:hypothetical protein
LDILLFLTHGKWCEAFLTAPQGQQLSAALAAAPGDLAVADGSPVHWNKCRDYLEQRQAIKVDHATQMVERGTELTAVRATLPAIGADLVKLAVKAAENFRKLRADATKANQEQKRLLAVFRDQYVSYGLAVA